MGKHIYVLGTGISHDGSACLLRDGEIRVAIEKERVTRIKHDGDNDNEAIDYCLHAERIGIDEVDVIVQNANFGSFRFGSGYYSGPRLVSEKLGIPVVTISHHLAHAYSAIGTCPFDECNVLVMDGCGNSLDDCTDLEGAFIPEREITLPFEHLFHEKDSYYSFKDGRCASLYKDFSEWGYSNKRYPMHPNTTKHSIGGLYGAVSVYCFGNMDDPGKLMGLGPYGRPGMFKEEVFELKDGRVFVNYDWMRKYRMPARSYSDFKKNFQTYADIAFGIQQEVERAILYLFEHRLGLCYSENVCYCGGTALNAVANARLLQEKKVRRLYMEPAAGDNGLALGCAFYGWLEVLKKDRKKHSGSTFFGAKYPASKIQEDINAYSQSAEPVRMRKMMDLFFHQLDTGQRDHEGRNSIVQLNIENFGVYQICLNGQLSWSAEVVGRPDCIMRMSGEDFCQAIVKPKGFEQLIRSGRLSISDTKEAEQLFSRIDLESVSRSVRARINDIPLSPGSPLRYRAADNYVAETARLLAEGKIVAWFQDGSEFGPRALGNRSILADPRLPDVKNFINKHIKFREDFRPFAPSVLLDDVREYFKYGWESPYMILVDQVREGYSDRIRPVVHVNGSSRVQTVTRDWNPKYFDLLTEFKRITGLPMLLNTSFNRKGMPIVETPAEALQFFFSCKLDHLIMDRFIVSKE
jgi:predicted NodU family carbamoyl transferase